MNLQSTTASNVVELLLEKHQSLRINFESDMPLPLDDVRIIDDLVSKADKDFTHNSVAIHSLLEGRQ